MTSGAPIPSAKDIAQQIIENSPTVAMRVARAGERWQTHFISRSIADYGYSRQDFLGGSVGWIDIIHPEDRDDVLSLLAGFDEMGNDAFTITYRLTRPDGSIMWISDATTASRGPDGAIAHYDCVLSDYTETKEQLDRIAENLRQQAVLNVILQGLHQADLDQSLAIILGRAGEFLDLSRIILFQNTPDGAGCRAIHEWRTDGAPSILADGGPVLNYRDDMPEISRDLRENGYRVFNSDGFPPGCAEAMARAGIRALAIYAILVHDERFGFLSFEECRRERVWNRDNVRFMDNVSRLIAPAIVRERNERLIQRLALFDQLTGLHNRNHLDACLNRAVERARADGRSGHVALIDLDDFKIINDAYGHGLGDEILKLAADFLRRRFPGGESVFRFGGDEFVVLLDPDDSPRVHEILGEILRRAQEPWRVGDRDLYCTFSAGVVRYPEGDGGGGEVLKNADVAMYRAKKMGKNNYMFHTSAMDSDSVARAEMEGALRTSIAAGFAGFEVFYQPLANLDGGVIGAEALVRWSMDGMPMSPEQFIPLAEQLGLIVPLGGHIMRTAARFCRRANEGRPDFFVTVNVSVRQFQRDDFLDDVGAMLRETGVRSGNIVLEVTEGMIIEDMRRMRELAAELRARGLSIAMDDFGTGYSSLGTLREIPFDVVKIDRTFINDVTADANSKSFIRVISDLAHSMGSRVCVEGVETAGQMRHCRECGVDYVQGYHLWRPMPEAEVVKILAGD